MDRPRFVIVEIPDGSIRVGLDESVEPQSPIENPEIQVTQYFMKVHDTCRYFTFMNLTLIIFGFSSDPDVIGLLNLLISIYSTMISHAKINISIHGIVTVYLPISIATGYSGGMAIYYISNFKWIQYIHYTIWCIMSIVSMITLECTDI